MKEKLQLVSLVGIWWYGVGACSVVFNFLQPHGTVAH